VCFCYYVDCIGEEKRKKKKVTRKVNDDRIDAWWAEIEWIACVYSINCENALAAHFTVLTSMGKVVFYQNKWRQIFVVVVTQRKRRKGRRHIEKTDYINTRKIEKNMLREKQKEEEEEEKRDITVFLLFNFLFNRMRVNWKETIFPWARVWIWNKKTSEIYSHCLLYMWICLLLFIFKKTNNNTE